ncbi:thioesterase [Lacinutrix sp. Bg11-31]|nr:thioesterase [Lacinutrix sp. Bg11-31]
MQVFTQTLIVAKEDLDELNHVNNVRYIDWVNNIAKSHWLEKASKNITDNYFWVLLSHTIDYKKPAFLNDGLLLKTYVTKAEGVTSIRIVEILNAKTNILLAKSETKWCFIDSKTLKPTRITEEIKKLFS